MRAYRPSQFGRSDDVNEEVDEVKQAKVLYYAQRVQAGLPLFEAPPRTPALRSDPRMRLAARH